MSTLAKHTPWAIEKSTNGDGLWIVVDARGAYVFSSADEALARLIGAAPDLLAALSSFMGEMDPAFLVEDDHGLGSRLAPSMLLAYAAIALATPVLEREG